MSRQLAHGEEFLVPRKFPIILLTDNVSGEANIGSLFRLADAFNIEKLVFCGAPVNLKSNRLRRTARATEKSVDFEQREEATEALKHLKQQGYSCYALEITQDSIPLPLGTFEKEEKLVLILGNERNGISAEILELTKTRIHIPMFGKNSSMNVAQAAAIGLYEITKSLPSFRD